GFSPEPTDPGRRAMLDTLSKAGQLAAEKGVTLAFETGQETADLLRRTLDDLKAPNIKVNFDPANMLLYDMGDPIRAVEVLGPDIRSVHVKDAIRPRTPGQWGHEVPLGQGEVGIPAFLRALKKVGYSGPLIIEREVGDQAARMRDIAHGLPFLRECLEKGCPRRVGTPCLSLHDRRESPGGTCPPSEIQPCLRMRRGAYPCRSTGAPDPGAGNRKA